METPNKIILVVWSWVEPGDHRTPIKDKEKGKRDDELTVKNTPYRLLRFDPGRDNPSLFDDFIRYIQEMFERYPVTTEFLLCLHTGHGFYPIDVDSLPDDVQQAFKLRSVKIIYFGSGQHHIYMSGTNRLGLLGERGSITVEIKNEDQPLCSYTIEQNEIIIKKVNFESVWNYYQFGIKREVFIGMQQFARTYWPIMNSERYPTEASGSMGLNAIKAKLETVIVDQKFAYPLDKKDDDKVQFTYYSANILELTEKMIAGIETFQQLPAKDQIKRDHLTLLRDYFTALLNALPEKTYA
jgi:hypothetical protein